MTFVALWYLLYTTRVRYGIEQSGMDQQPHGIAVVACLLNPYMSIFAIAITDKIEAATTSKINVRPALARLTNHRRVYQKRVCRYLPVDLSLIVSFLSTPLPQTLMSSSKRWERRQFVRPDGHDAHIGLPLSATYYAALHRR